MVGSSIMAAEKESLSLHVDISRVIGKGSDFISEEYGGGVEVLGHAVPHYPTKLFYLFFSHFRQKGFALVCFNWNLGLREQERERERVLGRVGFA